MLCKNPYYVTWDQPVGCNQCMPCRYNRRRIWTFRILLESMVHSHNSFLTLTYDEKHLPEGGTLVPRDAQLFIKRLRNNFWDFHTRCRLPVPKLRYYLVGEYGDNTWRPHYHLALFGASIAHTDIINRSWGLGLS